MGQNRKSQTGAARTTIALLVIFIAVAVSTFRSEMSMVNHVAVVSSSSHAG
ncbi:hypothetical protein Y026_1450 [Burkholderia pseudomallei TSV28]|uniref:hypothetical protein n=1 Tax=Burkholderia pseudomallei TaxID=28450 RepID=UPI00053852F9|nr:hypothetical protein [Burkholderia pseudomallei]KGX68096.1 hypothetical protein Y026_1450 [Burkholderia pseudomallei TSV28]